ncbi:hypothetical protein [Paenibacillus alba]|uniref:Uncharacterized protein n=1 Tax=Paenibacillus alba TaxID=1197127 RepID=A0ABU6FVP5_9BACL|nr:hypothetical protein [Paenibacillus alba]MEC0225810.1 hypothetical protein [Paenibacillus alba]
MIHQFSRSPNLQNIIRNIHKEKPQYSDEEIILHVDNFLPSYNCEGAALGYFSIIAHICYYRSDLEKALMKIAVKPLYYLGISDPENGIKWVDAYVTSKKRFQKNNMYFTSKQGEYWIQNSLIFKHELIASILNEINFEDNVGD